MNRGRAYTRHQQERRGAKITRRLRQVFHFEQGDSVFDHFVKRYSNTTTPWSDDKLFWVRQDRRPGNRSFWDLIDG
jgi:hypothetical protein